MEIEEWVLSPHDRERIGDILAGYGTWFTADLLRLCAHADEANLARIAEGFPSVVAAYLEWRSA
jgi:hypothetical protein